MLEMRLAMAVSASPVAVAVQCIPVQIALGVQPRHAVPFGSAPGGEFLVVGLDVPLAVVGDGRELAVVLQLVLELGELRHDPLALLLRLVALGGVGRAVHVIDALGDDDGPSLARRRVGKRRRVAGVVLRW
jgi:hypothetical protein